MKTKKDTERQKDRKRKKKGVLCCMHHIPCLMHLKLPPSLDSKALQDLYHTLMHGFTDLHDDAIGHMGYHSTA